MPEKIDMEKVLKNNPAINREDFYKSREFLEKTPYSGTKKAKYNILPPFTTRNRIIVLDETADEIRSAYIRIK